MSERIVKYVRYPDRGPSTAVEAPLWGFLLDLPYLGACGVFPPLHLLNALLRSGGKHPGTGASWEPFEISVDEYSQTLARVLAPDTRLLATYSRFPWQEFRRDAELDGCTDYADWEKKACAKHGQAYGLRLAAIQHALVTKNGG